MGKEENGRIASEDTFEHGEGEKFLPTHSNQEAAFR